MCVSNLEKLYSIFNILHKKKESMISSLPKITTINLKGEPIELSLDKYYKLCLLVNEPFPTILYEHKHIIDLLDLLNHEYINYPNVLRESLLQLVSIFKDVTLIFVDEYKGYCIWEDIRGIHFQRITRGHPRFRLCL